MPVNSVPKQIFILLKLANIFVVDWKSIVVHVRVGSLIKVEYSYVDVSSSKNYLPTGHSLKNGVQRT